MKKRDTYIVIAILAAVAVGFVFIDGRSGLIRLDAPGATLTLRSGLLNSISIEGNDQAVRVKARRYRPAYINLASDDGYQISSSGPFGDLDQVHVKPGQTLALKAGPPLKLKPTIRRHESLVSIDYVLLGRAGECYPYVMKGSQRVGAPSVEITDESGRNLASGNFEYG